MIKTTTFSKFSKSILFAVFATLFIPHAYAVDFRGGGNASDNVRRLEAAISRAGANGTVNLRNNFTINSPIDVNTARVTIRGNGNTITESGRVTMLIINARNVALNGVNFTSSSASGFRPQVRILAGRGDGLRVINCDFNGNGGGSGISVSSEPLRNFRIENCDFNNLSFGFLFSRNIESIPGPNSQKLARATNSGRFAGRFDIVGNRFDRCSTGIGLDAGNDGVDGAPQQPRPQSALRRSVTERAINYGTSAGRSRIVRNVMTRTRLFGIALALVENINVTGNTINSERNLTRFRTMIQLEHRCRFMNIANNRIRIEPSRSGSAFYSGILIDVFSGNPSQSKGCRDIIIQSNTISGTAAAGGRGIGGSGFTRINLRNNNMTALRINGGGLYGFFNTPILRFSFSPNPSGNRPRNP